MRSTFAPRRRVLAAAAATFAVAGGIAYAAIPGADGTYHGCVHHARGALRVIDPAVEQCNRNNETAITFSAQGATGPPGPAGPPGADGADGEDGEHGAGPTVAQLAPGDPNCPEGGAAITDAAGTRAYVCSGADGEDGADGEPFSGTFTSPNGEYTLFVNDSGVAISGDTSTIALHAGGIHVVSAGDPITVSGSSLAIESASTATVEVAANADIAVGGSLAALVGGSAALDVGTTLNVGANAVRIQPGAGCRPAARAGDIVVGGFIAGASTTVCIG